MVVMHQGHLPRLLLLNKNIITTPAPLSSQTQSSSSSSTGNGDSDFDSNMVIILAALLCALICALGLNSIVRCALRCSRRFAFETSDDDEVASRLATTGLKKDALKQIPVVVYKSGVNIPATECPICLAEFSQGEKVRILPGCNHGFHVNCIDIWLLSHSSCPTCRQLLFQQSAATTTTTNTTDAEA